MLPGKKKLNSLLNVGNRPEQQIPILNVLPYLPQTGEVHFRLDFHHWNK